MRLAFSHSSDKQPKIKTKDPSTSLRMPRVAGDLGGEAAKLVPEARLNVAQGEAVFGTLG